MMKSRIICILLLLVGASGIYAQSLTVTGKVVDNEGLEVIGGNVTVKGKQNTGTIPLIFTFLLSILWYALRMAVSCSS